MSVLLLTLALTRLRSTRKETVNGGKHARWTCSALSGVTMAGRAKGRAYTVVPSRLAPPLDWGLMAGVERVVWKSGAEGEEDVLQTHLEGLRRARSLKRVLG